METAYIIQNPIILTKTIQTTQDLQEIINNTQLYIYKDSGYKTEKDVYHDNLKIENNTLQATTYQSGYGNTTSSRTHTIAKIGDTIYRRPDEPEKIYITKNKPTPKQLPNWLTEPTLTQITPEN